VHVLAVNQFYAPDLSPTSQLLTELCEDLVRSGDRVTVVASRGNYLGGQRLAARERIAGVEVVRPFATSLGKGSVARRLTDYATFGASALAELVTASRPDVMLVLTTPPMIAAGAALVATARRIPLVTWIQDVYPEIVVAFGLMPARHPVVRGLELTARASHRAAARTVVLSEGMAERVVRQGQHPDRIRVIPNWADGAVLRPRPREASEFRRAHGFEGRCVAMYSGNLGAGHDLGPFVEAARRLEARCPELVLVFVGDGVRRADLERQARGLSNVRFFPYQPRERLADSLAAADVHLAALQEGLEGLLVPSKLYGVLAAGRPLLYLGPPACELARVVRSAGVGWTVRPGDVEGVAHALLEAARDPGQSLAMGERARRLFEADFDRPRAVGRWRDVLREARRVVGGTRASV